MPGYDEEARKRGDFCACGKHRMNTEERPGVWIREDDALGGRHGWDRCPPDVEPPASAPATGTTAETTCWALVPEGVQCGARCGARIISWRGSTPLRCEAGHSLAPRSPETTPPEEP